MSKKVYLLCPLSQEASGNCAHQSKGINKPRKRKTQYIEYPELDSAAWGRSPQDKWEQDARVTAACQVRRETSLH